MKLYKDQRQRFIYVAIYKDEDCELFNEFYQNIKDIALKDISGQLKIIFNDNVIHLYTERAKENYFAKRLETPLLCICYNTQYEISALLEKYNFCF